MRGKENRRLGFKRALKKQGKTKKTYNDGK